jgi:hypothetical protein
MAEESEREVTPHDEWVEEMSMARKLRGMLGHKGWTEVLEPNLVSQKKSLMNRLLTANLTKAEEFVLVRQSINAVDSIFNLIKAVLDLGDQAAENLKKEKEEEE